MNSTQLPEFKTPEEVLEKLRESVWQLTGFHIPMIFHNSNGSYQTFSYYKFFGSDQEEALERFFKDPDKKIKSMDKGMERYRQEDQEGGFARELNSVIEYYRKLQNGSRESEYYKFEENRLNELIKERSTLVSRLQPIVDLVKKLHEEYKRLLEARHTAAVREVKIVVQPIVLAQQPTQLLVASEAPTVNLNQGLEALFQKHSQDAVLQENIQASFLHLPQQHSQAQIAIEQEKQEFTQQPSASITSNEELFKEFYEGTHESAHLPAMHEEQGNIEADIDNCQSTIESISIEQVRQLKNELQLPAPATPAETKNTPSPQLTISFNPPPSAQVNRHNLFHVQAASSKSSEVGNVRIHGAARRGLVILSAL